METYSFLRAFADSWFLIAMFCFFLGTWVFAFWPSLKTARQDAATIPLRDEESGCAKDCANCLCKFDLTKDYDNG